MLVSFKFDGHVDVECADSYIVKKIQAMIIRRLYNELRDFIPHSKYKSVHCESTFNHKTGEINNENPI